MAGGCLWRCHCPFWAVLGRRLEARFFGISRFMGPKMAQPFIRVRDPRLGPSQQNTVSAGATGSCVVCGQMSVRALGSPCWFFALLPATLHADLID